MSNRIALTPWTKHVKRWEGGCGHEACSGRGVRVCLARGNIPADVLLCGEGPGESENVLGTPFRGPAGKLLDHIVGRGLPPATRVCFGNLVGCIPRDLEAGGKAAEPPDDQVMVCKPRLEELIRIVNPRLIVCVGALSRSWFERGNRHSIQVPDHIRLTHIVHPAAILRANIAARSLMVQKCVVTLADATENL